MSEEYIMKPKIYKQFGYLYYPRNKVQCPNCKYSTYNPPIKKGGTGWYDCSKKQQTRIDTVCLEYKQKE